MAFRGTLHALPPERKRALLASEDDATVLAELGKLGQPAESQPLPESQPLAESLPLAEAWDPVHRSLTDGYCRTDNGEHPLALAVLGGRQLHDGEDFIVSYVAPGEVLELVEALDEIDEAEFADRYSFIDEDDYGAPLDDEGLKTAWTAFTALRDFYERAAEHGHATVCVVEQ